MEIIGKDIKHILKREDGFVCCNCGEEFLYSMYENVPNHDPKRIAFYKSLDHKCKN